VLPTSFDLGKLLRRARTLTLELGGSLGVFGNLPRLPSVGFLSWWGLARRARVFP